MGRAHDVVAGHFVEALGAELSPGQVALGLDAEVVLAVGEIVVVQDDLVEEGGRALDHALDDGQVLGIGVAETLPALADAAAPVVRDASGDLDALGLEEADGRLEGLVVGVSHVAEGLDVHLVELEVLRKLGIGLLPVLDGTDAVHVPGHDVGRVAEVLIMAGLGGECRRQRHEEEK